MFEAFIDHLAHTDLIPTGSRVLVGYSGGADSTCLLYLLHKAGIDVIAGHLHHGQRIEADDEQTQCQAFCDEIGVPFASGKADVPQMASDMGIGLEEAGREARYTFFNQAAFRLSCDLIATAHTRTDHVETVLLNLARGTGMSGLGGIPAKRDRIVRPLLPFSREDCRNYCRTHGFWFHDDPSNEDLSFSRARVRHRILPELRSINPAADEAIARMTEIVDEEDRFLNGMAAAALEQSELNPNGALRFLSEDCEAVFDRAKLTGLPAVLFRRAVRLAVQAIGSNLDRDQCAKIEAGVTGLTKGSITTEAGVAIVEWNPDIIHVRQAQPVEPFRYNLTIPGETISDEFGWQFTASKSQVEGLRSERTSMSAVLPEEAIKGSLYFRTVQPGDVMRPLGFDGTRKLADLLSESKLTQAARARLPIVCDLVGPIWAPGVCLDQRMNLASAAGSAIMVQFSSVMRVASHNKETSGRD